MEAPKKAQKAPLISHRQRRMNALIRQILVEVFAVRLCHELPKTSSGFTITEVRVSPDIRHAKVFFRTLTGPASKDLEKALKNLSPMARRYLGEQLSTKYIPELRFVYDDHIDKVQKLESLFARVADTSGSIT